MTTAVDNPQAPNLEQTRHELRQGIETSRELVRQARELIELSECSDTPANDNYHRGSVN